MFSSISRRLLRLSQPLNANKKPLRGSSNNDGIILSGAAGYAALAVKPGGDIKVERGQAASSKPDNKQGSRAERCAEDPSACTGRRLLRLSQPLNANKKPLRGSSNSDGIILSGAAGYAALAVKPGGDIQVERGQAASSKPDNKQGSRAERCAEDPSACGQPK